MKSLAFQCAILFLCCLTAHAVPSNIEESFYKKYPQIEVVKWQSEANGVWEANYQHEGIKYRSDFDASGNWIDTEHDITADQLPKDVVSVIQLKYGNDVIRDIEAVDSASHGRYYDIEIKHGTENVDVLYDETGKVLDAVIPPTEKKYRNQWMEQSTPDADASFLRDAWVLAYKFIFNLITIFLYAYVIYYRRHHDHKMLFLLLAFNLFLFPIFLSSSLVTAGFGFTIFALLALVRLRSAPFDKAEISYLLGAISLTFVNTMLPVYVDMPAAAGILLTAYFADRPKLWRDSFQRIEVDYRMVEREKMLDQRYLRKRLSDELVIEVREITINRVLRNEVRLTLMYRDLTPEEREQRAIIQEKERAIVEEKIRLAALAKKQELAAATEKARLEEEMKMRQSLEGNNPPDGKSST